MAMTNEQYTQTIIEDTEVYFRAFTLADNFSHHEGDIEWIAPVPGTRGPYLVFKVSFSDKTEEVIERLMPDVQNGKAPSFWVLSPLSNPKLFDILRSKGFTGGLSGSGEWGMAADMSVLADLPAPSDLVEVKKVTSIPDFKVWMDVVNTALHGWDLLTIEHFSVWLERKELVFYLGYLDGVPVSTVATIQNSNSAGVEFVSTLEEYRHQGAAYAVCLKALRDLQGKNIETATLTCFSTKLYERLGFKPYYEQVFFNFQKA